MTVPLDLWKIRIKPLKKLFRRIDLIAGLSQLIVEYKSKSH